MYSASKIPTSKLRPGDVVFTVEHGEPKFWGEFRKHDGGALVIWNPFTLAEVKFYGMPDEVYVLLRSRARRLQAEGA